MFIKSLKYFLIERRTGKEPQEKFQIFQQTPDYIDYRLLKFIVNNWGDQYYKSPYGHSYYSEQVGWDNKPDKSYRLSDHWNFFSREKLHCKTSNEIKSDTHWSIGQYDAKSGKYKILMSYPKNETEENEIKRTRLKDDELVKWRESGKFKFRAKKLGWGAEIMKQKFTYLNNLIPEMDFYLNGKKIKLIKWGPNRLRYEIDGTRQKIANRDLKDSEYQGYHNDKLVVEKPKGGELKIYN